MSKIRPARYIPNPEANWGPKKEAYKDPKKKITK